MCLNQLSHMLTDLNKVVTVVAGMKFIQNFRICNWNWSRYLAINTNFSLDRFCAIRWIRRSSCKALIITTNWDSKSAFFTVIASPFCLHIFTYKLQIADLTWHNSTWRLAAVSFRRFNANSHFMTRLRTLSYRHCKRMIEYE